jgi:metal-responsive CopG/Arc/MetJ family transcriptional regulator
MPESKKEDRTVRVQVQMPESLRNKFKSVTAAEGQTMNEVILEFVEDYIETKTEEKPSKKRS